MAEVSLEKLNHNLSSLYQNVKKYGCNALTRTPLHQSANQIHDWIKSNADIAYWTSLGINAFFSPFSFGIGFVSSSALKTLDEAGWLRFKIKVIQKPEHKAEFAIVMTLSILFLKTILRGFICGVVAGEHVSRTILEKLQGNQPNTRFFGSNPNNLSVKKIFNIP